MKRQVCLYAAVVVITCVAAGSATADVAVVIPHEYTIGNSYFSAFAYNPLHEPHEFVTTGYGFAKDMRWSHVLDDTVYPWDLEGGVLMDSAQIEDFARNGFDYWGLSYNAWGMVFNPLDEKYFLGCISILKDAGLRVDEERDLIQVDPRLPNGGAVYDPDHGILNDIFVANTNGFELHDYGLSSTNGFVTRGVQVGDQLTMYALDPFSEIYAGTYTITQVVGENELKLDHDPLWPGSSTQYDTVSYIMMMQPWLTLGTFRANIPYYADDITAGPKAHKAGGLSPDGLTYYIGDIISENVLAVDTQVRETFSIFVSQQRLHDYVLAQHNAGRHHPIVNPDRAYVDAIASGWSNQSTLTTVNASVTDPVAVGNKSMGVTFNGAGAQLKLHASYDVEDPPRSTGDYTHLQFWVHGGATGGQQMNVSLYDHLGAPGNVIAVTPPAAGTWALIAIPIGDFGLATIGDIVYDNTAGASQPIFYLDDIGFTWPEVLPEGVGDFDTNGAGVASSQMSCDGNGRVFFCEGETDDFLWTTDGVQLNQFMICDDIVSTYIATGALDPSGYSFSNGVQFLGLAIDQMGTVYWGDNQTRSLWKAPSKDSGSHILPTATKQEIADALGIGAPRGLDCFSIRGTELLTFNFVESNTVYKVDMNTYDYGDFDGDVDADADDFAMFFNDCLVGPGVTEIPDACTTGVEEAFEWSDLDNDGDVDLEDFAKFQMWATGPLGS